MDWNLESSAETAARREWVEAGGMRFEVWAAGDPQAQRLALCLHGFPEHAYSWRHQLPLLARLGYKVWAPNQRGYGETDRPRPRSAYHLDALVGDVAALVAASGCQELLLIGHDWGGLVAWEAAARGVVGLSGLVIMNIPHPGRFTEELRNNREQRRRSRYAAFFQLPWLPEWLLTRKDAHLVGEAFRGMAIDKERFPDEVLRVYRDNALQPGAARAMLNWYRAAGRSFGKLREYPRIETPTLMIWGEEDSALGIELVAGTERFVKDLTVRRLPGVSHWVQQEAPERVNEVLEAWLVERQR
jgi:pimeloyl-ACP methyl ester carboxylesterase